MILLNISYIDQFVISGIFWGFPLCLGAIDGKHLIVQCPPNSGGAFYNYKDTFSTNNNGNFLFPTNTTLYDDTHQQKIQ